MCKFCSMCNTGGLSDADQKLTDPRGLLWPETGRYNRWEGASSCNENFTPLENFYDNDTREPI